MGASFLTSLSGGRVPPSREVVRRNLARGLAAAMLCAVAPSTIAADRCAAVVGNWRWFSGLLLAFEASGKIISNDSTIGSWNCLDRSAGRIEAHFGLFVDTLTLSPDNGRLSGTNNIGIAVSGVRIGVTPPPAGAGRSGRETRGREQAPASGGNTSIGVTMVNNSGYSARFAMFGQDGQRRWPGASGSWTLKPRQSKSFRISCATGETLCLGATSVDGETNWGFGVNGNRTSDDACVYTCSPGETHEGSLD